MNENDFWKDWIMFDTHHLSEKNHETNYYSYIDSDYKRAIYDCYGILIKCSDKKICKYTTTISYNLFNTAKINFSQYLILKNGDNLMLAMLSFLIIKHMKNFSYKYNENAETFNMFESDQIINKIMCEFNNLKIWLERKNHKIIQINPDQIRLWIHASLVVLNNSNFITSKLHYKRGKSLTFFSLEKNLRPSNLAIDMNYSLLAKYVRNENEIYMCGGHFSQVYLSIKANPRSGETFKLGKKSKIWQSLSNNYLYISRDRLENIFLDMMEENKILKENLENTYFQKIAELSQAIKENDTHRIRSISQNISILTTLLKINEILKEKFDNKKIYTPFMFDFRGRLYFLSDISVTNNVWLRYCSYRGSYEDIKIKNHFLDNVIDNELSKCYDMADEILSNIDIDKKKDIIWTLVSIAETQKNKMDTKISIREFISKGLEVYKNPTNYYNNIENKIKIKYLVFIIEEILKNSSIAWYICKDATASCYQHLIKILGHKNDDSLKYCNLSSINYWYNTYSYIIQIFAQSIVLKNLTTSEFSDIFNRVNLKKTIMTENYGAGYLTLWKYFRENIDMDKYEMIKQDEIKEIFKKFYKYTCEENQLLEKPTYTIIENAKKIAPNFNITMYDGSQINHSYYKIKKIQLEHSIENKRYTKQKQYITQIHDQKKFKQSFRANYIQATDAALVRWYLEDNTGYTIHDSFMVDYKHVTFLVSKLNIGMRIIFHDFNIDSNKSFDNLFSIFIVI